MTTLEILINARALIEKPENWGKGHPSTRPRQRCAVEAIHDATSSDAAPAKEAFRKIIGQWFISMWNDDEERTHADVLAAFDRAIEAERAKEAA